MKHKSLLVVLGLALSLAGCASLLTYGVRAPGVSGSRARVELAAQQQAVALMQMQGSLHKLEAAYESVVRENTRLSELSAQLGAEQTRASQTIAELSQEVDQLCRALATNNRPQLPTNWQQRLIEANRAQYAEIRQTLANLKEEDFPTARTWYGAAWNKLVQPFRDNQFPTEAQRDQLVQLLEDIRNGEQQRLVALRVTAPDTQESNLRSSCEKLAGELKALHY